MVILAVAMTIPVGCKDPGWKQEPTAFVGIALGQPLSASVKLCEANNSGTLPCAIDYGKYPMVDATDGYSILVQQPAGVVTDIKKGLGPDGFELGAHDLRERYGEPNYTTAHYEAWVGKRVTIELWHPLQPGDGAFAEASFDDGKREPAHKNPF